jgi:glycosyltransferase involved in cell wall biosynthesis
VAENCAIAYCAAGHDSAVLAYRGGGVREKYLTNINIPLFIGGDELAKRTSSVQAAIDWRPDIVHIHRNGYADEVSGTVIEMLAGNGRGIMETNVFARFDPTAAGRLIDVHILLSSWCLWKYEQWSSRASFTPTSVVVPNPVACERFSPVSSEEKQNIKRAWRIPESGFVYGRVGQPLVAKWSSSIISSFEKAAKVNENAYLVLIGSPPEYKHYVEKLPRDVRSRTRLVPFQYGDGKLRECYGGFDVFLHAADKGESFGMVLCEAMLCGIPVITLATPCKDNSQMEVVGQDVGGLVVRGKKYLADAMNVLAKNPQLCTKLGAQGRDSVVSRFDVSVVVPKLLEIAAATKRAKEGGDLTRELAARGDFQTRADWASLKEEASRGFGRRPLYEPLVRRLVHSPSIYSMWQRGRRCIRPLSMWARDIAWRLR